MNMRIQIIGLFLWLTCLTATAADPSIIGKWQTIDDKTNQPKSIVEIYEDNGKYSGRIIKLLNPSKDNPDPICDKCPDDDPRKGQKIIGMVILKDLVLQKGEYINGKVLDPEDGQTYKCKIWLEDGKLNLKGYVLFFYRTQTWNRVE